MITDFSNRIALVTGCLGGIGDEICALLAEAGATVIGADLAKEGGAWPSRQQKRCVYRQLDVTNEDSWRELAVWVEREYGALDVLVHNAGIALVDLIENMPIDDWYRQMAVNAAGPFLGTKAFVKLMSEAGTKCPYGSAIVMVSSIAGLVGTPLSAGYSATKGAVRLFTKSAALEFASLQYPVRVNSVHPGVVRTAMLDGIRKRYSDEDISGSIGEAVSRIPRPLGRAATPNDIAKAVRFLASDEAGYMNGSELVVDGGFTAS